MLKLYKYIFNCHKNSALEVMTRYISVVFTSIVYYLHGTVSVHSNENNEMKPNAILDITSAINHK